ncbi:Zinc finger and BTB domain-containing protein 4 [Chionoecetes opilio]|uniref:Zinc finger and BTB domain-containing protein 4 n=1 Tax=Chionoecetes opilio TaxID=41210 RepID=A0A8J4XXD8_CHIOP|nr:Zinc finger and BTB domain-containing protein 4 [Chionoecetes opilio]
MAQCGEGGAAGMLRRDAGCQRGTLGCEGHESQPTTPNEDCKFVNSAHPEAVLKGLNDLRKSGHFCDVTLCVDGRTFPVHRSVLASFSPYFRVSTLQHVPRLHTGGSAWRRIGAAAGLRLTSTITITEAKSGGENKSGPPLPPRVLPNSLLLSKPGFSMGDSGRTTDQFYSQHSIPTRPKPLFGLDFTTTSGIADNR